MDVSRDAGVWHNRAEIAYKRVMSNIGARVEVNATPQGHVYGDEAHRKDYGSIAETGRIGYLRRRIYYVGEVNM